MATIRLGRIVPPPQLTEFEHVLLGLICMGPSSGYGLKRAFSTTPLGVYQPSSGALYPALARLAGKGLIRRQGPAEPGRRRLVYEATPTGRTANTTWIRLPVRPETVARDLGLHLLRFVMMEALLSKDEILGWLQDLIEALSIIVDNVERHRTAMLDGPLHAILALDHGAAVNRASLAWARGTWETIATAPRRGRSALDGRRSKARPGALLGSEVWSQWRRPAPKTTNVRPRWPDRARTS